MEKGTQDFIHCCFKAAIIAALNKPMLSSLTTYHALSLVITKPSFIWLGSTSIDIRAAFVNRCYKSGCLNFVYMKNLEIIQSGTRSGN